MDMSFLFLALVALLYSDCVLTQDISDAQIAGRYGIYHSLTAEADETRTVAKLSAKGQINTVLLLI